MAALESSLFYLPPLGRGALFSEHSAAKIESLNAIGFSWGARSDLSKSNFPTPQAFRQRKGHCRGGAYHRYDGLKLDFRVSKQYRSKKGLSHAQITCLDSFGFL
jgi:hypothetical protein